MGEAKRRALERERERLARRLPVFLLNMFHRDRSKIKEWRESDHKTRMKIFQPGKVRRFLDTYDGFTGGKRDAAYRMFCEYAAHATWGGFALMGPNTNRRSGRSSINR